MGRTVIIDTKTEIARASVNNPSSKRVNSPIVFEDQRTEFEDDKHIQTARLLVPSIARDFERKRSPDCRTTITRDRTVSNRR